MFLHFVSRLFKTWGYVNALVTLLISRFETVDKLVAPPVCLTQLNRSAVWLSHLEYSQYWSMEHTVFSYFRLPMGVPCPDIECISFGHIWILTLPAQRESIDANSRGSTVLL